MRQLTENAPTPNFYEKFKFPVIPDAPWVKQPVWIAKLWIPREFRCHVSRLWSTIRITPSRCTLESRSFWKLKLRKDTIRRRWSRGEGHFVTEGTFRNFFLFCRSENNSETVQSKPSEKSTMDVFVEILASFFKTETVDIGVLEWDFKQHAVPGSEVR